MIYTYIVNIYHTTLHPMQCCLICNSKFQGFTRLECALLYMCIGVSTYPQKHQPSLFFAKHPINQKIFKARFLLPIPFSQFVPLYFGFWLSSPKSNFSVNPYDIKIFHPNFISSFKSLKVTKFLIIISQFKFLFVTENHVCLWTFFVLKHLRF